MNALCYKVIFSKRLGALVAVGENATSQGKSASGAACRSVVGPTGISGNSAKNDYVGTLKSLFVASTLACVSANTSWAAPAANTLPTNGVVQTGAATVSTNGAAMTINQSTQKASINWNSFSIGSSASVNVAQPNAQAVLLNRVVGNDPSQIFGKLTANGQVILINPNGIVFGKGGSVTASAFTASTFGMTEEDFKKGKYKYSRNGSKAGVTVEEGASMNTTVPGGYIALIASTVSNHGNLVTKQGPVIMAAAETVTLPSAMTDSVGIPLSGKVRLELAPSTINASVENGGTITTEGGQVLMQAAAVADAVASVTHTGTIDTTGEQGGAVTLQADHGDIKATGTIKANSKNAKNKGGSIIIGRDEVTGVLAKTTNVRGAKLESHGGFVETSGDWLTTKGATVLAKDWLLDPTDINIVASDTSASNTPKDPSNLPATGLTQTFQQTDATSTSEVLKEDIENAINNGTNVTITTTNPTGTGQGNITIKTKLEFDNTKGEATLKLQAKNGITQETGASITNKGGQLVHVEMTAEGLPGGIPANASTFDPTQSKGIVLNSTITTNGDVTIEGTTASSAQNGVRFNNGSGIKARSYKVTGRMTASSGGNTGAAQGSGVMFSGTSNFESQKDSQIIGSTASTSVYGLQFHTGATVSLDSGNGKLLVATDDTNKGGGVKIGYHIRANLTTNGDVTIGSLNNNASMNDLQGNITASGRSLKLLGQSASGGISMRDGNGFATEIMAKGSTSIHIEGVSTGAAHGVNLGITKPTQISSETGNISIKGSTTSASGYSGVNIQNNTSIQSVKGNITIQGNSASSGNAAIRMSSGSANTTEGQVEITGKSTQAGALGVWIDSATLSGPKVNVTGQSVNAQGVLFGNGSTSPNAKIDAGSVVISGTSGSSTGIQINSGTVTAQQNVELNAASGSGTGVIFSGVGMGVTVTKPDNTTFISSNGITARNGNVTVKTDSLDLATTGVGISATNGKVSIENKSAGTQINIGSNDVLSGTKTLGITNIELGKIAAKETSIGSSTAGHLAVKTNITSQDATGDLSLVSGGNIAIENALTVGTSGGKNLTLNAGGQINQNANGKITANKLNLEGNNATVALATAANQVNQLTANVKSIDFKNGKALQIGDGSRGITASGKVKIETTTEDLTLDQTVTTTAQGDADAVILIADSVKNAGESNGGNIKKQNNGSVSVGNGSTAKLYTGSIDDSTGMQALAGGAGSGKYRYNSDETTQNYTKELGAGTYAIYREAVTVNTDSSSMTYGNSLPTFTTSGLKNGDKLTHQVTNRVDSTSGNIKAGSYSITSDAKDYGYTLGNAAGSTLTVNQRPLTVSYTADNKVYDGTTAATVKGSMTDLKLGDKVDLTHTAANFSDASVADGKSVTISGIQLNSTNDKNDAANYTLVTNTSTAAGTANAVANTKTAIAKANITAPAVPKPPVPVVNPSNNGGTSRVKIPTGSANPFQLASAEDLEDQVCSANSLDNCHCEESSLNKGVDICYEPKTAGSGAAR